MKRTIIYTLIGTGVALILLFVFNKLTTGNTGTGLYTEVKGGEFEISLSVTGELIPERAVDITGPDFSQRRDIRSTNIRIQDLIPEGTVVKKGDYIATLDKSTLDNSLKDQQERLNTLLANLEMKKLDTAVTLNSLRDGIRNQAFTVEEAAMTLRNSKFEPPTVLRQAEINLDKNQRVLEQLKRSYTVRLAQNKTDIINQEYIISRVDRRVKDLEEVLAAFIIFAPEPGMVIYKREWNGSKRKVGSSINPFDRVVATLPDLTTMLSKTFVNEIDISKIKPGQRVSITIDAFPEKSFMGSVLSVAKIGEVLPNTNDKVFEVQIRIDGTDPLLRPSMTTGNKIIIKTIENTVFLPTECVHAGVDSIPFVYSKSGTKQYVLLGESNEKNVVVKEGLNPGTMIYINSPENIERFKEKGTDLVPLIKEEAQKKRAANRTYTTNSSTEI